MTTSQLSLRISNHNIKVILTALAVSVICLIVYIPALQNGFVDWDDPEYVYLNTNIQTISVTSITRMFVEFRSSNWHPLTWLSHALDFTVWGFNPMGHHLTSIIIHAMNTFLVVILIVRLVNINSPLIAAAVTGLLFGLHPLNVESVAWVSERKNVLYAFFFLLSILSYLKYSSLTMKNPAASGQKRTHYCLCLLFFTSSLMSKPMAVTLPVVLIILDFYPLQRLDFSSMFKSQRSVLIEKLPFFGLALVSSVLTLFAQQEGGALVDIEIRPMSMRILSAFRSLIFYLYKLLWPSDLVPFYSYPPETPSLALQHIGSIVLVICIAAMCVVLWKKQKFFTVIWAYYLATLLPIIGIVQVGWQSAADRYTYLPSLGPMLFAGLFTASLWEKACARNSRKGINKVSIIVISVLLAAALTVITRNQIGIWKNSLTLWNAELRVYPDNAHVNTALGRAHFNLGDYNKAAEYINKAIETDPNNAKAHYYHGMVYLKMENFDQAILDFNKAISLNPENKEAYLFRTSAYELAIKFYTESIRSDPRMIKSYLNRGVAFAMTDQYELALNDFSKAISIQPLAEAYYNRGLTYNILKKEREAEIDFQSAARMGNKKAQDYLISKGKSWQQQSQSTPTSSSTP
jgi:tetratricopeptide (TPR) repeat protein